ncbi:MAG: tetratricopeptide repeat protein [Desulfobacterales bacterium]|nr:tetratricopeptide repeat protein [Desulfobacterales bacterium]
MSVNSKDHKKCKEVIIIFSLLYFSSYTLSDLLKNSGRCKEAINYYQKAIALAPSMGKLHKKLGNCYQAIGNIEKSIEEYKNAIRCSPNDLEALN